MRRWCSRWCSSPPPHDWNKDPVYGCQMGRKGPIVHAKCGRLYPISFSDASQLRVCGGVGQALENATADPPPLSREPDWVESEATAAALRASGEHGLMMATEAMAKIAMGWHPPSKRQVRRHGGATAVVRSVEPTRLVCLCLKALPGSWVSPCKGACLPACLPACLSYRLVGLNDLEWRAARLAARELLWELRLRAFRALSWWGACATKGRQTGAGRAGVANATPARPATIAACPSVWLPGCSLVHSARGSGGPRQRPAAARAGAAGAGRLRWCGPRGSRAPGGRGVPAAQLRAVWCVGRSRRAVHALLPCGVGTPIARRAALPGQNGAALGALLAGEGGGSWGVSLQSFAGLDNLGRLRLLVAESTPETLPLDVPQRVAPFLNRLPAGERASLLTRHASSHPDRLTGRRTRCLPRQRARKQQ
jgi:hypothetical protein